MLIPSNCFNPSRYWLLLLVLPAISCSNYFKPVVATTPTAEAKRDVIKANSATKYLILRQGENSYAIKNVVIDNEALLLKGNLTAVDESHLNYLNSGETKNYTYKEDNLKSRSVEVLNEMHIYSKNTGPLDMTKPFSLPFDQISKIEMIQHDDKRTRSSHTWTGVGVGLGLAAVAAIIIASSVSISIGPMGLGN